MYVLSFSPLSRFQRSLSKSPWLTNTQPIRPGPQEAPQGRGDMAPHTRPLTRELLPGPLLPMAEDTQVRAPRPWVVMAPRPPGLEATAPPLPQPEATALPRHLLAEEAALTPTVAQEAAQVAGTGEAEVAVEAEGAMVGVVEVTAEDVTAMEVVMGVEEEVMEEGEEATVDEEEEAVMVVAAMRRFSQTIRSSSKACPLMLRRRTSRNSLGPSV